MKAFLTAIFAFLKRLLPFAASAKDKVAPEIAAEINRILASAKNQVASIKGEHSADALKARMEDDIKAVRETAEHHVALIKQVAEQRIKEAVTNIHADVVAKLQAALDAPADPTAPSAPQA